MKTHKTHNRFEEKNIRNKNDIKHKNMKINKNKNREINIEFFIFFRHENITTDLDKRNIVYSNGISENEVEFYSN